MLAPANAGLETGANDRKKGRTCRACASRQHTFNSGFAEFHIDFGVNKIHEIANVTQPNHGYSHRVLP
jgi:hypothetical protein